MSLSIRNRLHAQVKAVRAGSAVSRILVQVGESEFESIMTNEEADRLKLKPGDSVVVAIKPTDIVLQRARTAQAA